MNSYVYLITDGGLTKVGLSDNPKSRLEALQIANAQKLQLRHVFTCHDRASANWLESLIHKRYSQFKVSGEWFNVSADTIISDVGWAIDVTSTMKQISIGRDELVHKREIVKSYGVLKPIARMLETFHELRGRIKVKPQGDTYPISKMSKKLLIEWIEENPDNWQAMARGNTKREKAMSIAQALTGDSSGYRTVERVFDDLGITL